MVPARLWSGCASSGSTWAGRRSLAGGRRRATGSIEARIEQPTAIDSRRTRCSPSSTAPSTSCGARAGRRGARLRHPVADRPAARAGRSPRSTSRSRTLDFRDRMRERHGLPVGIDNDGNAAAIAEWQTGAGAGRQRRRDAHARHRRRRRPDPRRQAVPRRDRHRGGARPHRRRARRAAVRAAAGAATSSRSRPGIAATTRGARALRRRTRTRTSSCAARAGGRGRRPSRRWPGSVGYLGAGIATLVNALRAGAGRDRRRLRRGAGELLLEPGARGARRATRSRRDATAVRIVQAQLGADAGVIGAGMIAFEALDAGS